MKLLLHCCCAPCANMPIQQLQEDGIDVTAFWYNPNIHPFTEYRSRRNTLQDYASAIDLPLVVIDDYGLREFVRAVAENIDDRCQYCYTCRFEETAKYAAEQGFDGFTSSLFISPYQNHEKMREIATAMGEKYGVKFCYYDFRPLFRPGQQRARELEFYMQKYCGCVFSEEERYKKKPKKLSTPANQP